MYPPKPSDNPSEWLNGLWLSLQRGGDHFGGDAHLERGDEGQVLLRTKMARPLPKEIKPVVLTYMKQYARICGWNVKVRFDKGYCLLEASSRAASSASRKL